ncbi:unnamed protein product [Debaryomyces tyrocola]|nr:unnamed protein product [Debaryomyces tyrocola]
MKFKLWIIKNGEEDHAKRILPNMRGVERGKQEFSEIVDAMKFEQDSALSPSYWRMFPGYFPSKVLWMQIFQEWVGIGGVTVYQPEILKQAGFGTLKSAWLSGVNSIFYCISTLANFFRG